MPAKKVLDLGTPESAVRQIAASLNDLIDDFNTHSHKTPTTNPGITSEPVSNAPDAGSAGGTAVVNDGKISESLTGTEV